MSGNTFEIVFSGEILSGHDESAVKAKIGKLFNADEQKLARLFSGSPIVIKKGMDEQTANKYLAAFSNAGAKALVRDAAASAPQPQTTAPTAAASAKTATSGTVFEHSAEANATLKPAPQTTVNMEAEPDLSGLSLREPTGNLVDPSADVPEPALDLSAFSLAAPGSDLADKHEEVPPLEADLEGITLVDN